jgi:hypothetical protein
MKRFLLAAITLSIAGMTMMTTPHLHSQTTEAKKATAFACNMKALTPEQRKRHSEVLSPALRSSKLKTSELSDGYEFQFPSDAKTYQIVAEWVETSVFAAPSSTSISELAMTQLR